MLLLAIGGTATAQTLAHPGWRGNGIAPEVWWRHGAFVRLAPGTTFASAKDELQRLSDVGADSLILPDVQAGASTPNASVPQGATPATMPFHSSFGTEDDLDALLREAAARRMHVLLTADLLRLWGNAGELRFWLSRGIAGFDVGTVTPAQADTLQLVRDAMNQYAGRRLLLTHVSQDSTAKQGRQRPPGSNGTVVLSIGAASTAGDTLSGDAVEVNSTSQLADVPAHTVVVLDAPLLESDASRSLVKQALASPHRHGQSAGPAAGMQHHRRRTHRS